MNYLYTYLLSKCQLNSSSINTNIIRSKIIIKKCLLFIIFYIINSNYNKHNYFTFKKFKIFNLINLHLLLFCTQLLKYKNTITSRYTHWHNSRFIKNININFPKLLRTTFAQSGQY